MDVHGHDILYIITFRSNLKQRNSEFSFLHFAVTVVSITMSFPENEHTKGLCIARNHIGITCCHKWI